MDRLCGSDSVFFSLVSLLLSNTYTLRSLKNDIYSDLLHLYIVCYFWSDWRKTRRNEWMNEKKWFCVCFLNTVKILWLWFSKLKHSMLFYTLNSSHRGNTVIATMFGDFGLMKHFSLLFASQAKKIGLRFWCTLVPDNKFNVQTHTHRDTPTHVHATTIRIAFSSIGPKIGVKTQTPHTAMPIQLRSNILSFVFEHKSTWWLDSIMLQR